MTQITPSRLLSDTVIAHRAADGNQRAFATIFERYHQGLYRYCVAILGNGEDAHDAVQNTMLKVLRALPGEKRDLKLKPWLYRIAHNEAIDIIRARKRTDPIDAEALATGGGPSEEVEARGRLQQLISDIAELPPRQRGALVMREMSGLSYEQIGEALQTSPAVARQTIYEARLSLRQMSEGREMPCQEVMRAISDDDGRVLRRRDIRAHLLRCENCRAFRSEISDRRQEFASLAPLPAAVSAGILQSLLAGAAGGGNAASGVAGVAAGKALASSAAVKSAAAVFAVSAIGVAAANRSGVIDLGGSGHQPAAKTRSGPVRSQGRDSAETARPGRVAKASEPAVARRRKSKRQVRQASALATTPGSPSAPSSPSAPAEESPRSGGRHLGWSKGNGHGESASKPAHPAKGKKDSGAAAPGQSKGSEKTEHGNSERGGGKAKETHPAHPEHPAHPGQSQAAEPPKAEAVPPADTEVSGDEHGKPTAE